MSADPHDPTHDCPCAQAARGTAPRTPRARAVPAGLTRIDVRPGAHADFLASMLARLSTIAIDAPDPADPTVTRRFRPLDRLTTRDTGDFSIALLDAWACACDVLAFYHDRAANENYLATATERLSLDHLAALIGHRPSAGVAAEVSLAFTLEPTGPAAVELAAGLRVQSIPGKLELPQSFELTETITARPEFNELRPQRSTTQPLNATAPTLLLQGLVTTIRVGDRLLYVDAAGARTPRTVVGVATDAATSTTTLRFAAGNLSTPFPTTNPPLAIFTTLPLLLDTTSLQSVVLSQRWGQSDLSAFTSLQRWSRRDIQSAISHSRRTTTPPPPPQAGAVTPGVYRFAERSALFGHNAPAQSDSIPDGLPPNRTIAQDRTLSGAVPFTLDLDGTHPAAVPGSWVLVQTPSTTLSLLINQVTELSRSDYTVSAKVTRLLLANPSGGADPLASLRLREVTVLLASEQLTLAQLPITDTVSGSDLTLDSPSLELSPGRLISIRGDRSDLPGVTNTDIRSITSTDLVDGLTRLTLDQSLTYPLTRASVTINANVARATHGQSTAQTLGSGDSSALFQRFTLPTKPLTWTSAATPGGTQSTLQIRVDNVLWTEVDSLTFAGPEDRVYTTRTADDQSTTVIFGDGITGARLPTGAGNVTATYRVGIGSSGLVDSDRVTLLATKPLGVRSVTNPTPAAGAADPEQPEDIRTSAPASILTLGRVVSLRDFEDFARSFAGVAKALASPTRAQHTPAIALTVAGADNAEIQPGSTLATSLLGALRAAGDADLPITLLPHRSRTFILAARLAVDPAYLFTDVAAAAESLLRAAFAFDRAQLAAPVRSSRIIALLHTVPGVLAVDIDQLYISGDTPQRLDELTAAGPQLADPSALLGAELLTLDPRPLAFVEMTA